MLGISGTNKDIISSHTFFPHEYLVHEEKIFINHNLKTPIIIKDIGCYSDEQKKKFIKKRYNTFFRLRDNISKRCYDPIIHLNYGNTDSLCNDLENPLYSFEKINDRKSNTATFRISCGIYYQLFKYTI